jgi:hypothetical protein
MASTAAYNPGFGAHRTERLRPWAVACQLAIDVGGAELAVAAQEQTGTTFRKLFAFCWAENNVLTMPLVAR